MLGAKQMGALVVKGPLAVAHGAVGFFLVLPVGRMHWLGHHELLAGEPGEEDKMVRLDLEVVQGEGLAFAPTMAGKTGDGRGCALGRTVSAHEFRAAVAIDAGHAFLLVDVRGELVELDAVGPTLGGVGAVRGAVLHVEVMFKAAVIVTAHEVAVMAMQALAVRWGFDKGMAGHCAVAVSQMTSGAAGAVRRFRVAVAGIVHMAAQAAAAQQVIGKIKRGGDCVVGRDFRKRSKGGLSAKGGSDKIDLVSCCEMQRSGGLGNLLRMACAAGFLHLVRMCGLFDEPGMGLFLRCALRTSSVAVGAGEIVAGVEPDRRVATLASGLAGRSFLSNGLFRGLAFLAPRKGQGRQAEKQQGGAGFYVAAKRHGGICILRLDEYFRHTTLFAAMATSRNCIGKEGHGVRS